MRTIEDKVEVVVARVGVRGNRDLAPAPFTRPLDRNAMVFQLVGRAVHIDGYFRTGAFDFELHREIELSVRPSFASQPQRDQQLRAVGRLLSADVRHLNRHVPARQV